MQGISIVYYDGVRPNKIDEYLNTCLRGSMNPDIEAQVRACETRLYAAMLTSDVATLDRLIADNLLFVGPTGELATKAMDLDF